MKNTIRGGFLPLAIALLTATGLGFGQVSGDPVTVRPYAKQLAGPPSDFLSGFMAPIDAAKTGIRSHSAMVPVTFVQGQDGSLTWQGELAVESGSFFRMMVFSGNQQWDLNLVSPFGKRTLPARELAYESEETEFGMGDQQFPGEYLVFDGLEPGVWNLSATTSATAEKRSMEGPDGYILFSSKSDTRLFSYITERNFIVGNRVTVLAYGFSKNDVNMVQVPQPEANLVHEARLRVNLPGGEFRTVPMYDDGLHGDGDAADGLFGAQFILEQEGEYGAQVIAHGVTARGEAFIRTTEHVFPAHASDLRLQDQPLSAARVDEHRLNVEVALEGFQIADHYRVFAEVWGSSNKEMVPVAWIGGMVFPENGRISLGLDARWIGMSQTQAPFEIRNLRVEDADSHVKLAGIDRNLLEINDLPESAGRVETRIDEEMLMGPRPATANRAGSRLLLVHGYCSGNVWSSETDHFTNESVFTDLNQNRSHDQFAQLIAAFGSSYSSYGIVAHSQGGAASLHLYTYYWSGLDYAGSGRLIQSVGTPYQGTSLAGNLAALGSVFGVGCGSNNDLSYGGASSWLSGIPTWARNAVNYYTTSFDDRWWAYDYCNIATDLLLSDPDDGVVEKSKGQLSGGVNRGHKEDWCHTSGMRDPAQTKDGGRNNTMNANAAN